MSKLNYSVDGKYRWSGTFYLEIRIGKKSVFHTIGGSLTYSKNEGFNSELVLLFHEDTFKLAKIIEEGVAVKVIVARLIDADTGNAVNATMFNSRLFAKEITTFSLTIAAEPDFIIFADHNFYNPDSLVTRLDVEYNVWPEFNFPQSRKSEKPFHKLHSETKITDDFFLSCCETASYSLSEFSADKFFLGNKKNLQKINEMILPIIKEINDTAKSGDEKVNIKSPDSQRSYISFTRQSSLSVKDFEKLVYKARKFSSLLSLLTYESNTSIYKINLSLQKEGVTYKCPVLCNWIYGVFGKDDFGYSFYHSPLNIKNFEIKIWKKIVKNFYNHHENIKDFVAALDCNNNEKIFSVFHLSRVLDCLAVIGLRKKFGKHKYQLCVERYLGKRAAKKVDTILKAIPGQNIGEKITELRAAIVHFDNQKKPDIFVMADMCHVATLIISDYIFETIGLPAKLRSKYKKHYLSRLFRKK